MYELLEARCAACGFSLKGLDGRRAARETACRLCGLPVSTRENLSVSRRLPVGLGLLMGAFAASLDACPVRSAPIPAAPGFARMRGKRVSPPR